MGPNAIQNRFLKQRSRSIRTLRFVMLLWCVEACKRNVLGLENYGDCQRIILWALLAVALVWKCLTSSLYFDIPCCISSILLLFLGGPPFLTCYVAASADSLSIIGPSSRSDESSPDYCVEMATMLRRYPRENAMDRIAKNNFGWQPMSR